MPQAISLSRTSFCVAGVLACGLTKTKAAFFSPASQVASAATKAFLCHVKMVAVAAKRSKSAAKEAMVNRFVPPMHLSVVRPLRHSPQAHTLPYEQCREMARRKGARVKAS